jgi:hypothetical protein
MSSTAISSHLVSRSIILTPGITRKEECVLCEVLCEMCVDLGKGFINGCCRLGNSLINGCSRLKRPMQNRITSALPLNDDPAKHVQTDFKESAGPPSEGMEDVPDSVIKTSKYVNQFIFNLSDAPDASWRQKKAESQKLPSVIIDFRRSIDNVRISEEEVTKQFSQFKDLTHQSRIEIFGHGGISHPDAISSDPESDGSRTILDVDAFVEILKTHASHLIKKDDGQRIKISINSCFSASSSSEDCFARNLSRALDNAGIPAEVVGRTGLVLSHWDLDHSTTYKTVNDRYHHTGDKISMVTVNGVTTSTFVQYPSFSYTQRV